MVEHIWGAIGYTLVPSMSPEYFFRFGNFHSYLCFTVSAELFSGHGASIIHHSSSIICRPSINAFSHKPPSELRSNIVERQLSTVSPDHLFIYLFAVVLFLVFSFFQNSALFFLFCFSLQFTWESSFQMQPNPQPLHQCDETFVEICLCLTSKYYLLYFLKFVFHKNILITPLMISLSAIFFKIFPATVLQTYIYDFWQPQLTKTSGRRVKPTQIQVIEGKYVQGTWDFDH